MVKWIMEIQGIGLLDSQWKPYFWRIFSSAEIVLCGKTKYKNYYQSIFKNQKNTIGKKGEAYS